MKQIKINATQARKNLYKYIDLVAEGNTELVIEKQGLQMPVVLRSQTKDDLTEIQQNNQDILKKTFGSIKTTGYKEDEFEIAKDHFRQKYPEHGE